uniref:Uncharacterized protein n=1 Tax=Arion vulgaris TaxID=1028688 RepID=A0A0B6ZQN2_9EUPU
MGSFAADFQQTQFVLFLKVPKLCSFKSNNDWIFDSNKTLLGTIESTYRPTGSTVSETKQFKWLSLQQVVPFS